MTNNFFPTLFQEYIYLSRYSRWLPEQNRRENWTETVNRYFNFFEEHLKEKHNHDISSYRKELEEYVLSLKVMPSMRCLMTAGEALKRENVAGFNCLAAETKVTTKEYGHIPIHSLKNKTASVLTNDGSWVESKFRSFGEQNLLKVSFVYNKHVEEVFATPEHDWLLTNGVRVQTKNLKKGMEVPLQFASRKKDYNDVDYKLGIIHGLIYGDGTAAYYKQSPQDKIIKAQKRIKGYKIRLCSDKEDLLPYFYGYTVSYSKHCGDDPLVYLYDSFSATHDLKELPSEKEGESYLVGFFRGWLAADGYVGKNGDVSLCLGEDEEEWVRRVMPVYGIHFKGSHFLPDKTNFGTRKKKSKSLKIWRASLTKDDILIKRKRDRFVELKVTRKIHSVLPTNRREEVFCATVPGYHNFAIENGIITGNCSYIAVDNPRSFDEILYVLMNGTGIGFSVETKYVEQLPIVAEDFFETDTTIIVADSKLGWARAVKELIHLLYSGQIPRWDVSKVRPAGAPLRTFGGRASGPGPLVDLFKFCVSIFRKSAGRKLTTLECHDIVCKIAEIVVVGGVRRSALISLSDLSDDRMRYAKSGQWWIENVQRALANNSAAYNETPDIGIFMDEWKALYESKSGERGIFNRDSAKKHLEKNVPRRDSDQEFGVNPCGEILLRNRGFCNLSEAVIRSSDTDEDIKNKLRVATILGTWQSTLTNYKYISKKWKENSEEERLLGVSLTGIMDNDLTSNKKEGLEERLSEWKNYVVGVNKEFAKKIGIPHSAAITCVKPSGTVSSLVDSASGIHARHSPYYVRTVRADKKDPLAHLMRDMGFPVEDDITKPEHTFVFSFPMISPENAIYRNDMTAIEQLNVWLKYKTYWTEHNPSITISVKEHEWLEVGAWVYKNFDNMTGVSFLPYSDHVYKQAPFQEITKEEYEVLKEKMPESADWSLLQHYEKVDATTGTQELACVSGSCELM